MRGAEVWNSVKEIIGYEETHKAIGRLAISGVGFFVMTEHWTSEPAARSIYLVRFIGFAAGVLGGFSFLDHAKKAAGRYRMDHPPQSSKED